MRNVLWANVYSLLNAEIEPFSFPLPRSSLVLMHSLYCKNAQKHVSQEQWRGFPELAHSFRFLCLWVEMDMTKDAKLLLKMAASGFVPLFPLLQCLAYLSVLTSVYYAFLLHYHPTPYHWLLERHSKMTSECRFHLLLHRGKRNLTWATISGAALCLVWCLFLPFDPVFSPYTDSCLCIRNVLWALNVCSEQKPISSPLLNFDFLKKHNYPRKKTIGQKNYS